MQLSLFVTKRTELFESPLKACSGRDSRSYAYLVYKQILLDCRVFDKLVYVHRRCLFTRYSVKAIEKRLTTHYNSTVGVDSELKNLPFPTVVQNQTDSSTQVTSESNMH